jgi:hypothetical protein
MFETKVETGDASLLTNKPFDVLSQNGSADEAESPPSAERELEMWMRALGSFFNLRNHPLSEAERNAIDERDFLPEMQIVHQTLVESLHLTHALLHRRRDDSILDEADFKSVPLAQAAHGFASDENFNALNLTALAETLNDAIAVCETLLVARIGYLGWMSFGRMIARELKENWREATISVASLISEARDLRASPKAMGARLAHPALLELTKNLEPAALGADLFLIFAELQSLLDLLQTIEKLLGSDAPLKKTLPIFTLAHQRARSLIYFIETRALCVENLRAEIFDALDGTAYAIGMELNKVFAHELAGVSAMRHAPAIYAKIENANGLLRDCFQQSTATLAQAFDETLTITKLFNTFEKRFHRSIVLREDLWRLMSLVKQAEAARDCHVAALVERLNEFQRGSLRYLMYKDWESYERFVEEVMAARGATELMPVLHRFGTYLEALFGQINMRAVLINHPFEYPNS